MRFFEIIYFDNFCNLKYFGKIICIKYIGNKPMKVLTCDL